MKRLLPMLFACLCLFHSSVASAQLGSGNTDDDFDTVISLLLTSYYGGIALLIGLPLSLSGASTIYGVRKLNKRKAQQAERYIKENSVALASDVTLGGGRALTNLGRLADVPPAQSKAFYKLVRMHRRALVPLLQDDAKRAQCVAYLFGLAGSV